jgi:hypothetical protein
MGEALKPDRRRKAAVTRSDVRKQLKRPLMLLAFSGLLGFPLFASAQQLTRDWVRLSDWKAQTYECLVAASRSHGDGMLCKFAQASELPKLNKNRREWFGEFYDPAKYRKCLEHDERRPSETTCEFFRLMRQPEPEYWPYSNVQRPKLPDPPNPPVYKRGMTSKDYFQALCKAEAGEFIYKVVENVEGIYQIRPRKDPGSNALFDRYVMEDPYGYTNFEATRTEELFVLVAGYRFFETPPKQKVVAADDAKRFHPSMLEAPPTGARVQRFLRDAVQAGPLRKEYSKEIKSRYGFTWRGISRPHDRELAIAGGELIVVDLQTGEVLGVRRGFARSGFVSNSRSGIQWESAEVCPQLRRQPNGFDKSGEFSSWFLAKVLRAMPKVGKE